MRATRVLSTINTHTGGEPTCIITGGIPAIPGKTMQEKTVYMREHEDRLRTAVCLEPRGGFAVA